MARLPLGGVGPPVRPLDRAVFEEYLDRDFENLSAEAHSILAAAMEFDGVASTLTAEKRPAENADTVAYDTTGVSTDSEAVLTTCRRYLSLSASPQATIRRPAIAPQMGVQSGAITPEPLGPRNRYQLMLRFNLTPAQIDRTPIDVTRTLLATLY